MTRLPKLKISWQRGKQYTSSVTLGGRHKNKEGWIGFTYNNFTFGLQMHLRQWSFLGFSRVWQPYIPNVLADIEPDTVQWYYYGTTSSTYSLD